MTPCYGAWSARTGRRAHCPWERNPSSGRPYLHYRRPTVRPAGNALRSLHWQVNGRVGTGIGPVVLQVCPRGKAGDEERDGDSGRERLACQCRVPDLSMRRMVKKRPVTIGGSRDKTDTGQAHKHVARRRHGEGHGEVRRVYDSEDSGSRHVAHVARRSVIDPREQTPATSRRSRPAVAGVVPGLSEAGPDDGGVPEGIGSSDGRGRRSSTARAAVAAHWSPSPWTSCQSTCVPMSTTPAMLPAVTFKNRPWRQGRP